MGFLLARAALAEANGQLGREALAVDGYQQVVDEMTRLGRGQNAIELALLGDLARHLSRAGQWRRADAPYRRGMALAAELDDTGNADPMLQANFAVNLVELGDLGGADRMPIARWKARARRGIRGRSDRRPSPLRSRHAPAAIQTDAARSCARRAMCSRPSSPRARCASPPSSCRRHGSRSRNAMPTWLPTTSVAPKSSLFLGEALLVLGEVAAAQDDRVAARSALGEAVRQLGDAVGDRAPLDFEATRALAAIGPP